ncbi:hypothetical protein GCM10022199_01030 [Marihabitans asiaticum]|uniref:Uncharacterized protein n=1 Tax=Marihabitans asiaticum TaxID=415218 RepID=A0A560WG82_9MICO|nr:hypothetical protein [Marihabitans asiaticum]TWD16618.1 hypothetical protein FB557_0146 [Marihabitans asiaticum]
MGLVDEVSEDAVERAVEVARSWTDGRSAADLPDFYAQWIGDRSET